MCGAETSRIKVAGWRGNRTWAKGQKKGKAKTCTEVQAEKRLKAKVKRSNAEKGKRRSRGHSQNREESQI
jgi:hypothetical protein